MVLSKQATSVWRLRCVESPPCSLRTRSKWLRLRVFVRAPWRIELWHRWRTQTLLVASLASGLRSIRQAPLATFRAKPYEHSPSSQTKRCIDRLTLKAMKSMMTAIQSRLRSSTLASRASRCHSWMINPEPLSNKLKCSEKRAQRMWLSSKNVYALILWIQTWIRHRNCLNQPSLRLHLETMSITKLTSWAASQSRV